jgi:eukaryotic-like serine/threonine-protein kinase
MSAPRTFGRYEVQEEIGDGAMGRVYRCLDPLMRRTVAVKTVKSEYLTRDTAEEYLRRFRREAQAAGQLSHPNIVSIFDVGEDYFVMEYLEGATLQRILNVRRKLHLDEALTLLAPVAEALDYAHRARIVHRDVKPANIMVLHDGRPKLMDFGVAFLASSLATAAGAIFGSPSYMAPEQIAGHEVTHRADLFAFAVVAYEVITGQRPFQGDSITAIIYRVVNDEAPPPRKWDGDLPAVYDDIFRCALRKAPTERYPDATSLITALQMREFDAALLVAFPHHETPALLPPAMEPLVPPTGAPNSAWMPGASDPAVDSSVLRNAELETHALVEDATVTRSWRSSAPTWALAGVLLVALGVAAWLAGTPQAPAAALAPAAFRIESEPSGAEVWLDDHSRGTAPVSLADLQPGRHKIRVEAAGYAPAELSLEIPPGAPPPPLRFVMEPVAARIAVTSEPPGARVQLDGRAVGSTPLEPMAIPPGRHRVQVDKAGFTPFSREVVTMMGEGLEVNATLAPLSPVLSGLPTPPTTLASAWVAEGDLVSLDSGVKPPTKISGNSAPYPEIARRMGMLGTVGVEMIVDEHGVPQDLRIAESAGQVLDRAVLDAMRKWRFEPATKNGVKVKVRWHQRQSFVAAP